MEEEKYNLTDCVIVFNCLSAYYIITVRLDSQDTHETFWAYYPMFSLTCGMEVPIAEDTMPLKHSPETNDLKLTWELTFMIGEASCKLPKKESTFSSSQI